MRGYLGLGSNLGDRRANLSRALKLVERRPIRVERVSPVVESPAMLPDGAPPDWDRPYLNLAAACESEASPKVILEWCKAIERDLGREPGQRWSPRPMDIDILLWGDEPWLDDSLTIPHPGLRKRNFVLTPMLALEPRLVPPGANGESLLESSRGLADPIPLWMGIVNVTPDSFSDGGRHTGWSSVEPLVRDMIEAGVQIIDVGGESTRPGASTLRHDEEWLRVAPVLEHLLDLRKDSALGPQISIDTYHAQTARRALDLGVDMVNDVGGLASPAMIELARDSGADWVAMHQLSLPVDPRLTLPADQDPFAVVENWLLDSIERWQKADLDLNRIVFDPGIGFGKTPDQSWQLLRRAGDFRRHGLRVLVGHSRKSFLRPCVGDDMRARDSATVGVSLSLGAQGVDIIRVHDVPRNVDAHRGWSVARGACGISN